MKAKMKFIPVFLALGMLTLSNALAQGEQIKERLKAQRIAFFTEKLDLSQEEAQVFWPVYNDYSNRKDRISSEMRNMRIFLIRNSENMSDEEMGESLEKYVSLVKEENDLFIQYHSKFLDILSKRKVMRLYLAEDQFKQYLLRQLRERGQNRRRTP